jgi:hypothetical protein
MIRQTTSFAPSRGRLKDFKLKHLFFFQIPSTGQLLGHEEQEPISPAIPEEGNGELVPIKGCNT